MLLKNLPGDRVNGPVDNSHLNVGIKIAKVLVASIIRPKRWSVTKQVGRSVVQEAYTARGVSHAKEKRKHQT